MKVEEEKKDEPDIWLAGIKDNLHYTDDETGDETIESHFPIRRKRDRLQLNVITKFHWRHDRQECWIYAKTSQSKSEWRKRKIDGASLQEGLESLAKKPFHRRFEQSKNDGFDSEFMIAYDRGTEQLVLLMVPNQEFVNMDPIPRKKRVRAEVYRKERANRQIRKKTNCTYDIILYKGDVEGDDYGKEVKIKIEYSKDTRNLMVVANGKDTITSAKGKLDKI